MLTIAWRGVKENPFRFLATGLAIIVGISFFVGTSVLTTSVSQFLNSSVTQAFSAVDAVVQSSSSIQYGQIKIRPRIKTTVIPSIRALPQVDAVAGLMTGYAQVVGADGKVLSGGSPSAFNWITQAQLNPWRITTGHAPETADQITLDQGSFTDGSFHLGQRVRLLPLPADHPFTIVGVMAYKASGTQGELRQVALNEAGAALVFGTTDANQILVSGRPGVSPASLVSAVKPLLPSGLQAVTGQQFRQELQDALGTITNFISTVLRIFALVALVVGAFIIYNTFSIVAAQRVRELALLRAIGATRRQVTSSVLLESLVVGLVSSVVGSLLGLGLGWVALKLFAALGIRIGSGVALPPGGLVAGVLIGTLITLAAAYLPGRRAARTPPIAALRDVAAGNVGASRGRATAGVLLLVAGVVVIVSGLVTAKPVVLLVGGVALLAGVLVLGPVMAKPLALWLAAPVVRLRGAVGELARLNAARNPRRTATTSSALMIGVTLVAGSTVFAATIRSSLTAQTSGQIKAPLVVSVSQGAQTAGGGIAPAVEADIAALPGVTFVSPLRTSIGNLNGSLISVSGVSPAAIGPSLDPGLVGGRLGALAEPSTVAVAQATATANGLRLGSTVHLTLTQQPLTLRVVALYAKNQVLGNWVISNQLFDTSVATRPLDRLILVGAVADRVPALQRQVGALLADNPTAQVQTTAQYARSQGDQVNTLLYVMYGLLGFAVLVALIGIVNTLALSIVERTREIGLLRAVGMTRRQLSSTIRYEAGIVALIGTALGIVLGIILGWLASEAARSNFPVFTMPWVPLVVIALAGLLCGIVAGALPARRAARFNVLAAIANE